MFRPMRPKPLIPTLVIDHPSPYVRARARPAFRRTARWADVMLGGAARGFRRYAAVRMFGDLLQTSQSMVHRRLRKRHPIGQLAEVQLRVRAAPARHIAQCLRESVELAGRFQTLARGRLPRAASDRLAYLAGP